MLHDGILADSELPEVVPNPAGEAFAALGADAGAPGRLEVVFVPSPSVHDGRFANDGWLQELPDPLTKLTWDNPALVGPKTAETLGVTSEDVVRLEAGGRSVEIPVWIVPGMADGVVALTLGYGRRRAGRVGTGVGFDTFALRTSAAAGFAGGVTVSKLGRTSLALGDAGPRQHGRAAPGPRVVARELTTSRSHSPTPNSQTPTPNSQSPTAHSPGESAHGAVPSHEPKAAPPGALGVFEEEAHHFSLWKEHKYDTAPVGHDDRPERLHRLQRLRGRLPEREQRAGRRQGAGARAGARCTGCASTATSPASRPAARRSCSSRCPACTARTRPASRSARWRRPCTTREGLNVMVYNRCIGTRYCSNNCPYKVRRFNFFNYTKDTPEVLKLAMNPDVTVRARGVMEKCTYCVQRINRGEDRREARRPRAAGRRREDRLPAGLPGPAIDFGDLRDQSSRVAKAKADPRNYALLDELNTKPRTTYLARLRNPHPELGASGHDGPSSPRPEDRRGVTPNSRLPTSKQSASRESRRRFFLLLALTCPLVLGGCARAARRAGRRSTSTRAWTTSRRSSRRRRAPSSTTARPCATPCPARSRAASCARTGAFFDGQGRGRRSSSPRSPVPRTTPLLARGAERYAIYCPPCHDARGDGKGILFQRGNVPDHVAATRRPIRKSRTGTIFDVITNGRGLMPAYRWPIPPADRWAIIAHVREIQRQRPPEAHGGAP